MSNKSGTSPQAITLPTGGGALSSIGETFTPDLFTGSGTFAVPIEVPAGRNGFQPELRLTYSTGDGNGPFGLGWSVAVPSVSRRTSHGVPRYADGSAPADQDTFVLSGSEDLVPVAEPQPGVTRFRPRTEGPFACVDRDRSAGGDVWRVATTDGLVSTYGAGAPPAVVADPADRGRIFRWLLSETTDPFGNRIAYEYRPDTGADGPHRWDQLYLERISYVDHEQGGATRFLVTVTFVYEERPDPFSEHRGGFEVRTRLRCRRIEVRSHADADVLARTYELEYLDDLVGSGDRPAAELPLNRVSLLSRITVVGHDGDRTEALPPIVFGYSRFEPQRQRFRSLEVAAGAMPLVSLADADLETVDLFGNGLPDIVQLNESAQFWRNLGGGRFDRPREMDEVPAGVRLSDPGVQFADMNGDGRADLLSLPRRGYFPLAFGGRWSAEDFVQYPAAPSVEFGADDIRLVDLDGDGVTDALRTGTVFELFFNDPQRGWDRVETRPRRPPAEFPDVQFSDPRVKLTDLTGDGLQDIALVESGRIDYWPYLGHGRWGRRVRMAGSPVFSDGPGTTFDPRRVLFGDLDGDGLDDVVYVKANQVTCWINQGGGRWSEPFEIDGTPPFDDIDAVRLTDVLGSGMDGVLWSNDPVPGTGAHYRYLDLTGGLKPYLLARIDNHRGAVTNLSYTTSTSFYVADEERPATRWKAPLPFPAHVVERVKTVDEISGGTLTNEFRYHHGYWDGVEREFRGFGMVEQLDTEVLAEPRPGHSPPLLTRTWFHQGPVGDESDDFTEQDPSVEYWPDDPAALGHVPAVNAFLRSLPRRARRDALRALRGRVLRTEVYAIDGSDRETRPFTVTEHAYALREESAGDADRPRIFFPHQVAERVTQWDRGAEPMTSFTFTDGHDRFGQPGREIELFVPRGRDFRRRRAAGAEPYLGTVATTTYAQRDDDRLIVDRVAGVTTHEIRNDGRPTVFEVRDAVRSGDAELAIVGQTLTHFDGEPFEGLDLGQLGDAGVAVRVETLVLTEELLGEDGPPYLAPDGAPRWTDDYPAEFRALLPQLAGYTFSFGGDGMARGYFAQTERRRFDGRGMVVANRDPLGRDSTIEYDAFALLPVRSTDPVGLTTEATYDYRVLQPSLSTDANGNRTAFAYTPLGLLERMAVMGKDGETVGDTLAAPGTRFVHDLAADGRPVSVRTIRRVHHVNDAQVPAAERNETIETVEYSDGFGRLVQTRSRAEDVIFGDSTFGGDAMPADQDDPATTRPVTGRRNGNGRRPNVVVSGWQVYDNKGRVVERYEPFFAKGWEYAPPTDVERGQRVTMTHDARGRLVRATGPDGSEQRVVHGTPTALADPDSFTPTPWEVFTYDENDNAGRTHAEAARRYDHHWNTPSSAVLDAMGRTVATTERNRVPGDRDPGPVEDIRTTMRYDIRGNCVAVIDALGRQAYHYTYDLAGEAVRVESIDAGLQRLVVDAAGQEIERRDAKGALILHAYDALGRQARVWARDDPEGEVTLRERVEHGDGGDADQPPPERSAARAANLLGNVHRQHDEAGVLTIGAADFKGRVLERVRQVVADDAGDDAPLPSRPLDPTAYETSIAYDALDRVTRLRTPAGTDGERREVRYGYDRAGNVDQILLDETAVVERIAYDAKGQRTLVALGNGIMTRHAYDARTTRLVRLRSERYTKPSPAALTYRPTGAPFQDLAYQHDQVGNLVETIDRTPGCGIAANPEAGPIEDPTLRSLVASGDALVRRFGYDAVYRLVSASGRECVVTRVTPPWSDGPGCGFNSGNHGTPDQDNAPNLTAVYRQAFDYDAVGNLLRLTHAGSSRSVRQFQLTPRSNRLATLRAGETAVRYRHDAAGNVVQEATSRHFEWDHRDRMKSFRTQAGQSEPSIDVRYVYDAAGTRVKKVVRKPRGHLAVTTYIDGIFEHHRWTGTDGAAVANTQVQVVDGDQRRLSAREGTPHPDDRGSATQYVLTDHLGSGTVVVDDRASFVNREEFTPYGETSFGGFAKKRYRFNGKERDEENGLSYHGARYYAPWLGRWMSCDPAHGESLRRPEPTFSNLYSAFALNPVRHVDPDGRDPTERPKPPSRVKRWGQKALLIMRLNLPGIIFDPKSWQPEGDQMAELSKEAEIELKSSRERKPRGKIPGPPSPPTDERPTGAPGRAGPTTGQGRAARAGRTSGPRDTASAATNANAPDAPAAAAPRARTRAAGLLTLGGLAGGFVAGLVTNKIATAVAVPPEVGQRERDETSALLSAVPPGADIALGAVGRLYLETFWRPFVEMVYLPPTNSEPMTPAERAEEDRFLQHYWSGDM